MIARKGGAGRWIIIAVLVLAIAAASFAVLRRNRGPNAVRTAVELVEMGQFTRSISGSGIVEAARERNVIFKTSGTVADILVSEGDLVESGELLAQLDASSLKRELASNRANLQSAEADLARIQAQQQVDRLDLNNTLAAAEDTLATAQQTQKDAENNLSTIQQLFATGAASQNELDAAQDRLAQAERQVNQGNISYQSAQTRNTSFSDLSTSQIASSEANITSLQTAIANLEEQLAETELIAPFSGIITDINIKVGNLVGQSPQDSIQLVDNSSLSIKTNFDENRALELRPQQPALITPDADTNSQLKATVSRVGAIARREGTTAQVEAILNISEDETKQDLIKPGYTVTTKVTVNELDDVLLIPLEAISEADAESWVYKVSESEPGVGTASKVTIDVLDRNATLAAAKSSELKDKDLIAVINLDDLAEGELVEFTEPTRENGTP